jgi:hypothetical protein
MGHIDSVYSFGHRTLPWWLVTRDHIREDFLRGDKPQWKNTGGLRRQGTAPNLNAIVQEMVGWEDSTRTTALMEKYIQLNSGLMENLDQLRGRDIIFTDPVSPVKLDPQFLFSYLSSLHIDYPEHAPSWYGAGMVDRVWHDPYSPLFAQTDAILTLAKMNPRAFESKIFWPVSPVAFPSEIIVENDDIILRYALPDVFDCASESVSDKGKIGLGSKEKRWSDFSPFVWHRGEKIGNFVTNPRTLDRGALEDLLIRDRMSFDSRIKHIEKTTDLNWKESVTYVREEIAYHVALRKEIGALFYAKVLDRLNIKNPVLFAPKGSSSYDMLDRATKRINERTPRNAKLQKLGLEPQKSTLTLIGAADSGPLDPSKKSPYWYLESSALERLNGWILNPIVARTARVLPTVRPHIKKADLARPVLSLNACPYAPVLCEEVYVDAGSCAREEQKVSHCTRDLFDHLSDVDYQKEEFGQPWIDWFNQEHPKRQITSVGDHTQQFCREKKFIVYSIEQVAWLLNNGPNYEVYSSTDVMDRRELDEADKRRLKARTSWYDEKGSDILFPFEHDAFPAPKKDGRISSLGSKCDLGRIFAVNQHVHPKVFTSDAAARGTGVHELANGSVDQELLQERLWERMGLPRFRRHAYAEQDMHVTIDDAVWSGHSDGVFLKAPQYVTPDNRGSAEFDLVIVDLKTSQKTFVPSKKHRHQLTTYALGFIQAHESMSIRNIYTIVVTRPMVSDVGLPGPFTQQFSIVRMRNSADDPLLSEVKDELTRTVAAQKTLLHDVEYLHTFKAAQVEKSACNWPCGNYSKTGCFDDTRLKCEHMFTTIGGRSLAQYVLEERA